MMCSNCSGERSFTKLNLIKNTLSNTMKNDRLSALNIMNIEPKLLNMIEFDDILNTQCFHRQKLRK